MLLPDVLAGCRETPYEKKTLYSLLLGFKCTKERLDASWMIMQLRCTSRLMNAGRKKNYKKINAHPVSVNLRELTGPLERV